MLVRTQISLSSDDHRRAKRRASELGISLAEYIRRLIADDLGRAGAAGDVTRLFALGESEFDDVATNVDAHLAEVLEKRFPRDPR